MPRTKGAKDKKDRRPKGAGSEKVNMGQERPIEQHDDMGTNSGTPEDFTAEANQNISEMNNDTAGIKNEESSTAGAGNNPPPPVEPPSAGNAFEDMEDDDLPENPPNTDYSAINEESVIERKYAVNPILEGNPPPIPEPEVIPPSFDDDVPETPGSEKPKEPEPINPALKDKSPEEILRGAEMMADGALHAYGKLWDFGYQFVEMPPERIVQLHEEGKIDSEQMLHLPGGDVRVIDFISSFNRQAKDVLVVSDKFKEAVRPPLIRVFVKRGIGASDEQYLLYMFGQDILVKGGALVGLKMTVNNMIKVLQKTHQETQSKIIKLDEYGDKIAELEQERGSAISTIQELKAKLKAEMDANKKKDEELKKAKSVTAADNTDSTENTGKAGKAGKVKIQKKPATKRSMREPEERDE